jgi:arylsulfatase A-like enzyme
MLRTYGDSLAAAVSASVFAAAVVAIADAMLAGGGIAAICLGLYALPALGAGIALGVIGGAWRATFGEQSFGRAIARLRRDPDVDREVVAAAIAVGVVAALFVGVVAVGSTVLVAGVERKTVGALLLGVACTVAIPVLCLLGLPVYRAARRLSRVVPRVGPVPASLLLVAVAAVVAVVGCAWFVTRRLDWRALNVGWLLAGAAWAVLALGWHLAWHLPRRRVQERIRALAAIAAAAGVAALAAPILTLRGTPTEDAAMALTEQTQGARVLVAVARSLRDADGDGFSAFLAGPDCDDGNPDVHPEAKEVAGNGIDDNCVGGDRPARDDSALDRDPDAVARPEFTFGGNVLVVAIDTLRADRLGVAGYRRPDHDGSLTPRLVALAGAGVWFSRVYAQAPNTPRSFPSLFSSRYPSQVKVAKEFANYSDVLAENEFLFELLQRGGMRTIGVSSHFYFDKAPGIRQGFDEYDNEGALDVAGSNKDTAAPRIVPKVEARLAELGRSGDRFAMFVHLFEPHSTYMQQEGFAYNLTKTPSLIQKYDFEIAYVDRWLGRILDALDESGLADNTMVVVLSDHGEAFGDHRFGGKKMFFHGQTLYDELLRVPLIVKLPGVEVARVDDPVSLLDVAPTIADALGLAIPDSFVGRSLLPRMLGRPLPPRPIFAELVPAPSWNEAAKAMITGDGSHKLIYVLSQKRFELYDLAADPSEQKDLHAGQPELARRLQEQLVQWMEVELP